MLGIPNQARQDKNYLSHILKIGFGETGLLFGGDTHLRIWMNCLQKYESKAYDYLDKYGKIASHFVKVSHHGSSKSSSKKLWREDCNQG